MLRHLGYVGANYTIEANTSRTCRVANASPDRLRSLIAANLAEQERIFAFNAANGISLYRLSSQTIPFASHPCNELAWWNEFEESFKRLKNISDANGFRLSMHPGQYTVLNSPDAKVVAASIAELEASARLLDLVHGDASGKIVLHVGGAYGDRKQALKRFEVATAGLSEAVRRRLVIENDDSVFSAAEVLSLSDATGFPVVFDWFHHTILPSPSFSDEELIRRCFASWRRVDGLPKTHISSQSPGGRVGHHADYIDAADACEFLATIESAGKFDFDMMVEAKKKDLALLRLRGELASGSSKTEVAN